MQVITRQVSSLIEWNFNAGEITMSWEDTIRTRSYRKSKYKSRFDELVSNYGVNRILSLEKEKKKGAEEMLERYEYFLKVVEDFLNAWKKIDGLSGIKRHYENAFNEVENLRYGLEISIQRKTDAIKEHEKRISELEEKGD